MVTWSLESIRASRRESKRIGDGIGEGSDVGNGRSRGVEESQQKVVRDRTTAENEVYWRRLCCRLQKWDPNYPMISSDPSSKGWHRKFGVGTMGGQRWKAKDKSAALSFCCWTNRDLSELLSFQFRISSEQDSSSNLEDRTSSLPLVQVPLTPPSHLLNQLLPRNRSQKF